MPSLDDLAGITSSNPNPTNQTKMLSLDDLAGDTTPTTKPMSLDDLAGDTTSSMPSLRVANKTLVDANEPTPKAENSILKGLNEKDYPIGFVESLKNMDYVSKVPVVGTIHDVDKYLNLYKAVQRQSGKQSYDVSIEPQLDPMYALAGLEGTPNPMSYKMVERKRTTEEIDKLKAEDKKLIDDYVKEYEEVKRRGKSFGAYFAEGVTELPSFMTDFILTSPIYGGVKVAAKEAAEAGIKKLAKNEIENAIAKKSIGLATEGIGAMTGTAARTVAMAPRVAENALERQMTVEDGEIQPQKSTAMSIAKAFGDTYIENLSEISGGLIGKGLDKVGGLATKGLTKIAPETMERMTGALTKAYKVLHPQAGNNEVVSMLLNKSAYNGFLEELGEERVGDILRYATGLQDNVLPSLSQLGVEAAVIAVPTGVGSAVNFATSKAKEAEPTTETTATTEPTETTTTKVASLDDLAGERVSEKTVEPTKKGQLELDFGNNNLTSPQLQNVIRAFDNQSSDDDVKSFADEIIAKDNNEGKSQEIFNEYLQEHGINPNLLGDEIVNKSEDEITQQDVDVLHFLAKLNNKTAQKAETKLEQIEEANIDTAKNSLTIEQRKLFTQFVNSNPQLVANVKRQFGTVELQQQALNNMFREANPNNIITRLSDYNEQANKQKTEQLSKSLYDLNISLNQQTDIDIDRAKVKLKSVMSKLVSKSNDTAYKYFSNLINSIQTREDGIRVANRLAEINEKAKVQFAPHNLIETAKKVSSLFKTGTPEHGQVLKLFGEIAEINKASQSKKSNINPNAIALSVAQNLRSIYQNVKSQLTQQYGEEYANTVIPQQMIDILDTSNPDAAKNITSVEGYDFLQTELKNLHTLLSNVFANRFKIGDEIMTMKEFEAKIKQATDVLDYQNNTQPDPTEELIIKAGEKYNKKSGRGNWFKRAWDWFGGGVKNQSMTYLSDKIAGYDRSNIITRILDTSFNQGRNRKYNFLMQVNETLKAKLKEADITEADLAEITETVNIQKARKAKTFTVELGNKKLELTLDHLIDLYLTDNDTKGHKHLVEKGWYYGDTLTGVITDKQLDEAYKILKTHTKAFKLGQIYSDMFNKVQGFNVKDAINKISQIVDNRNVANIDNYWHLETYQTDMLVGKVPSINLLESMSFLQQRTPGTRPIIGRGATVRFFAQIDAAADYVGYAEALRHSKLLLNNQVLQTELKNKGYVAEFETIVKIIKNAETTPEFSTTRTMVSVFNSIYARGALQLNVGVIAGQGLSVMNYAVETSPIATNNIIKNLNPLKINALNKEAMQHSGFLYDRFNLAHQTIEMGEFHQGDSIKQNLTGRQAKLNKGSVFMKWSDSIAMAAGWRLSKEEVSGQIKLCPENTDWFIDWAMRQGKISKAKTINQMTKEEYHTAKNKAAEAIKNIYSNKEENSKAYWDLVTERAEFMWLRTQSTWDKFSRSENTSDTTGVRYFFFMFRSAWEKLAGQFGYNQGINKYRCKTGKIDALTAKFRFSSKFAYLWFAAGCFSALVDALRILLFGKEKSYEDVALDFLMGPLGIVAIGANTIQGIVKNTYKAAMGRKYENMWGITPLPVNAVNDVLENVAGLTKSVAAYFSDDSDGRVDKMLANTFVGIARNVAFWAGYRTNDLEGFMKSWFEIDTKQGFTMKGNFEPKKKTIAERIQPEDRKPLTESGSPQFSNPYEKKLYDLQNRYSPDKYQKRLNNKLKRYGLQ